MSAKREALSWTDSSGNVYHYYHKPMLNAVIFVLLQELCERLAFFGITPNAQTFFKEYLNYTDAEANSYIATFQAILYVRRFSQRCYPIPFWAFMQLFYRSL
ncbi:hypothetical protein FOZ63_000521 [Perkinsus olseni]|uniref:Uncharacterized protein n=1 Tax=Perkinsus olseni TaxID=32597 RepID=A0A7J6PRV8_PEROL|nr:hypothetical protein FOZ63_000521 [Perkinsus olseni]